MTSDASWRQEVVKLLRGGNAHADFEAAIKDLPAELRGKTPKGAEHSPWQLLEHLRIAQWDIVEFSRDPAHKSPDFPSGYWPTTSAPPDDTAWEKSVRAFRKDLKTMCELVENPSTDLGRRFPAETGRRFCARLCWLPTTTLTIWGNCSVASSSGCLEVVRVGKGYAIPACR